MIMREMESERDRDRDKDRDRDRERESERERERETTNAIADTWMACIPAAVINVRAALNRKRRMQLQTTGWPAYEQSSAK